MFKDFWQQLIADAASEPEPSEQISSSNLYWGLKVRLNFRFAGQNALLLTDQNVLHARCYKYINAGNLISTLRPVYTTCVLDTARLIFGTRTYDFWPVCCMYTQKKMF
jgi:hypothetical protein